MIPDRVQNAAVLNPKVPFRHQCAHFRMQQRRIPALNLRNIQTFTLADLNPVFIRYGLCTVMKNPGYLRAVQTFALTHGQRHRRIRHIHRVLISQLRQRLFHLLFQFFVYVQHADPSCKLVKKRSAFLLITLAA